MPPLREQTLRSGRRSSSSGQTSIGTIDANGVALASIQALADENAELKKELSILREEVRALADR